MLPTDQVIDDWLATLDPAMDPARTRQEIVAVGWATVDLDRAASELGGRWSPAPDDRLLGATVRRSIDRARPILLLEPTTEGRLAGALARHGEGPIALYVDALTSIPEVGHDRHAATRAGLGPFGAQRLRLAGPPSGPFAILVDDPASANADRVPSEP